MTVIQIAWMELIMVSGTGVLFVLGAVMIRFFTKKKNQSCTAQAYGTVISYKYFGEGRMQPVVEFSANGRKYKATKKYNGIKSIHISGEPIPVQEDAWEDGNGYLHVKTGPFANTRELSERLWPLGSRMMVFYCPDKPKVNYVDRPITNVFIFMTFMAAGFLSIGIGVFGFFLIRL